MNISTRTIVEIDEDKCQSLAYLIGRWSVPEDREEIEFQGFSNSEIGNLLLFVVAICHQTSPRGEAAFTGTVSGKSLKGWDYLLQRFVEIARDDRNWLNSIRWRETTPSELSQIYRTPGSTELSKINRRAELLNDLGFNMCENSWDTLEDLHRYCKGQIVTGSPNLVDMLSRFEAYSDPVRKKSFFLLALMKNLNLFLYADPENLGAPVDYHEVRGHLRLGTVRVKHQELERKLRDGLPVTDSEDIALRDAVFEAIMRVSELTGLRNPSQLHYLFWNLFRNFCTHENPNCHGIREEKYLPTRYKGLEGAHESACPFRRVCVSACEEERYIEHVVSTEYY